MGLQFHSLTMLLVLSICWPTIETQTPVPEIRPARALDAILQDYAYRAFVRPRTGVPYDGFPPLNLPGIQISAIRLRSGSLFTRGVRQFREFSIPVRVVEQPYVERLVLVYQNLANWSNMYYPLTGYTYLAPILGLLAYDASNLSAKNLPELEIDATDRPISIEFTELKSVTRLPNGSVPRCVSFDLNGRINFTNVVSGNKCLTPVQGHFSIVVESDAATPALPHVPVVEQPSRRHGSNYRVWVIVGSVVGGLVFFILFVFLVSWVWRFKKRKKMRQMEKATDASEALRMTTVGNTKAPLATTTRTQPSLETEYVP